MGTIKIWNLDTYFNIDFSDFMTIIKRANISIFVISDV